MKKNRSFIILSFALMLALLATSVPLRASQAQGNQPNCPPPSLVQNLDPAIRKSIPRECLKQKNPTTPQIQAESLIVPQAVSGPDDFGYTYDDTVSYNWIDVPENNGFSGADDYAFGPVDLYFFSFPFYGSNYPSLYISSNGLITFDQGSSYDYGGENIPSSASPNNFIAPFWEDLVVGNPYNSGGIWYTSGGTAPDRYFVVEWKDVTTYNGSDPFSFEVILYENGDILVQLQSLPAEYYSTVGIENATGDDGIEYQVGDTGLSAALAIKFFYPTAPTPRLQVTPLASGKFASSVTATNFPITIKNNGSAGTDTYDVSAVSSWGVSLYQDGCVTPLTDTDADATLDTGPIPEGSSITICVGFSPPAGAGIGDMNNANVTVTSSLDPAKTKRSEMSMVVPTSFAQVFEDNENAAPTFRVNQPEGILTNYPTNDLYYGEGLATIGLPDGRYFYTWNKKNDPNAFNYSDIEFTFISEDGTSSTPVEKLTSNINNRLTMDFVPSVAVTPNGTIGVIWYRFLADDPGGVFVYNFNIYFATLSGNGSLLSGPINVTNNTLWDDYDNLDVPHFYNPVIAATSDGQFVLGWEDQRTDGAGTYNSSIWYSTFDATGTSVSTPQQLPSVDYSYNPILNPLNDGNSILTFEGWDGNATNPYFAVLNGDGTVYNPVTNLDPAGTYFPYSSPDAVALSNGNIAIAWPTYSGIALSILDPSYNNISGPTPSNNLYNDYNQSISITHDADDRIAMTWMDFDGLQLFYALADDTGTFITNPIPMRISTSGLTLSYNGQGNAPYPIEVQKNVLDDFNRTDGAIGGNWSGHTSKYRISDNQLSVKYNTSNTDIYWNEPFGADQEAFITFNTVNESATEQDLLLKAQSADTWGDGVIEVLYDAPNQIVQVWTWEWPQGWVKYGDDIPVTFVDGDTFGAIARSNGMVEVYRNGSLLGSRDVSTWSHFDEGGYIGLWFIGAGGAVLDDFGGGTLP